MLMERDLKILDWIDNYKAITIEQAQHLFFNGSYEAARRRLSTLENDKTIKSYTAKATKQKVFYVDKKISDHDIYILDYIKALKSCGCEIVNIKIKPRYLNDLMIADAFVKFKFNKYTFNTLLEVDYTHFTELDKLNVLYEKLAKDTSRYEEFNNRDFILVIAKPTTTTRYNSKNYDVIYTDLKYKNLYNYLGLEDFQV